MSSRRSLLRAASTLAIVSTSLIGSSVLGRPAPRTSVSVVVVDHDTDLPLAARVIVTEASHPAHILRSLDAGDGRAKVDVGNGDVRITATRGPEYTVDSVETHAASDETRTVTLRLRRVLDTPGWVACDFHVHGRESFDSHLSSETRVRSLVAAGVDFAAPTEHDRLGSYGEGVTKTGLRLAWAPSVEVTTRKPDLGHFNVLGFSGKSLPTGQSRGIAELLDRVRKDSPDSLLQVNHPRFGAGMGFFNLLGLDVRTGHGIDKLPRSLDAIEVYNGMDLRRPARVDAMVNEWLALFERGSTLWATGGSDAHHEGGMPPGYPRTYVAVAGDDDGKSGAPVVVGDVVDGARHGRSFVTNGPLVDVRQAGRGPGGELTSTEGTARLEITVRGAPWMDVTSVDVLVGGERVLHRTLPPRALEVGAPQGSLDDARRAAIRFHETVDVPIRGGARSVVVVARGERSAGEAVPGLDFVPFAFSNPMIVRR